MVWDKEFSLRMICDNFCIVDDWCRTDWDVVWASVCEHADETNHLSSERTGKYIKKPYVVFLTRW